jgi:hypothetical protein
MNAKDKTNKVSQSTFSNEWTNPSGGTTYYFDLVFENGDTGSIGVTDMNSDKVRVGTELYYSIINGKIKATPMPNTSTPPPPKSNYRRTQKGQEQYLGFTWGYAKDLIIAGKTMEDVEELNKVARYIYDQIGDMLNK